MLHHQVYEAGDALKVVPAKGSADKLRGFIETCYAAASWATDRRVIARFETTILSPDARYIVATLTGETHHLCENFHCQQGQADSLILADGSG